MNTRRKFLIGLAALGPALAHAQLAGRGGKPVRVGILRSGRSDAPAFPLMKVFIDTMREQGWVEGRNIVYDVVFAEGDDSRLPELAGALLARQPELIYVGNNPQALAAFGKTRTIPIVFNSVTDPVNAGLVQSLARPGGNVTGIANIGWELGGRRMQLLKEALPKMSRVGVLRVPGAASSKEQELITQSAGAGIKTFPAIAKDAKDIDTAVAALAEQRVEGWILTQTALFMSHRQRILAHAAKQRVPVMGYRAEQAQDGALMSYGSLLSDLVRRAAQLADKVLRGTKPADIPVEQPTRFELVINMKTAKALGITIPQSILLQAERVIE